METALARDITPTGGARACGSISAIPARHRPAQRVAVVATNCAADLESALRHERAARAFPQQRVSFKGWSGRMRLFWVNLCLVDKTGIIQHSILLWILLGEGEGGGGESGN